MERLDELIEIVREMDKVKLTYADLEEQVEQIKTEMREQNEKLLQQSEKGGVSPTEKYKEYIDPKKITYLTINDLGEADKAKLDYALSASPRTSIDEEVQKSKIEY